MWQWVVSPEKAPDKPTTVEIGFEAGTPVSVNGKKLEPRRAARATERNRRGATALAAWTSSKIAWSE